MPEQHDEVAPRFTPGSGPRIDYGAETRTEWAVASPAHGRSGAGALWIITTRATEGEARAALDRMLEFEAGLLGSGKRKTPRQYRLVTRQVTVTPWEEPA